jgi:hypothetical protein
MSYKACKPFERVPKVLWTLRLPIISFVAVKVSLKAVAVKVSLKAVAVKVSLKAVAVKVSLKAVADAIGNVQEVHFILFGSDMLAAYQEVARSLFLKSIDSDSVRKINDVCSASAQE